MWVQILALLPANLRKAVYILCLNTGNKFPSPRVVLSIISPSVYKVLGTVLAPPPRVLSKRSLVCSVFPKLLPPSVMPVSTEGFTYSLSQKPK